MMNTKSPTYATVKALIDGLDFYADNVLNLKQKRHIIDSVVSG